MDQIALEHIPKKNATLPNEMRMDKIFLFPEVDRGLYNN